VDASASFVEIKRPVLPQTRIMTLVGAGGIGTRTRLALQAVGEVRRRRIFFFFRDAASDSSDLAALRATAGCLSRTTIAQALRHQLEKAAGALVVSLAAHLRGGAVVLAASTTGEHVRGGLCCALYRVAGRQRGGLTICRDKP
jgi:hypothetical protein